jgi:hypothetical protein
MAGGMRLRAAAAARALQGDAMSSAVAHLDDERQLWNDMEMLV